MTIMPETYSVKDVQASYKAIFDNAKSSKKPIIVLKNNKPEVAIIDIETLEEMYKKIEQFEMEDLNKAIQIYKKEKKAGKLRRLNSLDDLFNE